MASTMDSGRIVADVEEIIKMLNFCVDRFP